MTSCKVLNSSQTTLTQMYKCIQQNIAICGWGWIMETTNFQATTGVWSKFDLYAKIWWPDSRYIFIYCAYSREVCLSSNFVWLWPQETDEMESTSQALWFVFHGRDGWKNSGGIWWPRHNFIYVEGILNGSPLLAFFLFVATEWHQRAEAITSVLY